MNIEQRKYEILKDVKWWPNQRPREYTLYLKLIKQNAAFEKFKGVKHSNLYPYCPWTMNLIINNQSNHFSVILAAKDKHQIDQFPPALLTKGVFATQIQRNQTNQCHSHWNNIDHVPDRWNFCFVHKTCVRNSLIRVYEWGNMNVFWTFPKMNRMFDKLQFAWMPISFGYLMNDRESFQPIFYRMKLFHRWIFHHIDVSSTFIRFYCTFFCSCLRKSNNNLSFRWIFFPL